jgi:hypothetical protein
MSFGEVSSNLPVTDRNALAGIHYNRIHAKKTDALALTIF